MTVWLLQQTLTEDEEARIAERSELLLPFGDMPDMAKTGNVQACKKILQEKHPDDPPETISWKTARLWRWYSELQPEDVIAVPLFKAQELAVAEVTGTYAYRDGKHLIPVKWHEKRVPAFALRKHKALLQPGKEPMAEVDATEVRIMIRDRLPHRYNRFVNWKWLLIIFMILNAIHFLQRFGIQ